MKVNVIAEQQQFFKKIIKQEMRPTGVLKKSPIDERKLLIKAMQMNLNMQSTTKGGQREVNKLIRYAKRHGITKSILEDRPGLKSNPLIINFLKDTKKLKEALINYLGAK